MSTEQLMEYSRWMGWLIAVGAWMLVIVIVATRRRHIFDSSQWLILAWLIHIGLFFTVVRWARELGAPLPPVVSNIWSVVVYLQALLSIGSYILVWIHSHST